jgi:hypothetical protein
MFVSDLFPKPVSVAEAANAAQQAAIAINMKRHHQKPKGAFIVSHPMAPTALDQQPLPGLAEAGIMSFMSPRKPVPKKPTATLAQMRQEFEKEPPAPVPNVVQAKDADEKKAREVHVRPADESRDDDERECWTCRGTGEGQFDGQRCPVCRGTGVEPSDHDDDDFDIPDDIDEDTGWPFKRVDELSTDTLAQYKKAAAADASAADKAGNFKRGDKRFSGIVKATKKQFANDVKKHYANKEQGVAEGDPKTHTRGDPHADQEFYFPVKDQWPEKLGPMGKPKSRPDVAVEDAWTGSDNQWHSEQGDPWKGSDNQWHESAEAGPVECHGYAYNRRDQRVMFTKTFANETAARVWADQHNATILDCRPARTKQEDSNMPVATDSTSPLGGKIDEDYEDYLDAYLAEMRQVGYEV